MKKELIVDISIISLIVVISLLSTFVEVNLNPGQILSPPSLSHPLGTDDLGRDILLLTSHATWNTFSKSFLVIIPSFVVGLILAIVSEIFRGKLPDLLIIWLGELIRSLPGILIILFFLSLGLNAYLTLIIFYWIPVWRMLRALFIEASTWTFFQASIVLGNTRWQALLKHGLPNMYSRIIPLLVGTYSEIIGSFIVIDFLALGPNPTSPTLGGLVAESLKLGGKAAWVWLPSLLLIIFIFLSIYSIINILNEISL